MDPPLPGPVCHRPTRLDLSSRGPGESATESRAGAACGQVGGARQVNKPHLSRKERRERERASTSTSTAPTPRTHTHTPALPPHRSATTVIRERARARGADLPAADQLARFDRRFAVPLRRRLRFGTRGRFSVRHPQLFLGIFLFCFYASYNLWVCDGRRSDGRLAAAVEGTAGG